MGTDRSDDDAVTEISVEIDPSDIAEITISRAGESPITVSTDTATTLPADSEPRTLEPQTLEPLMTVRGLVASPIEEEEEERTTRTQSVEARLLEAYATEQRAKRGSTAAFGPIITPSEPFRVTSPSITETKPAAKTMSSASLLAAAPATSKAPSTKHVTTQPVVTEADRSEPTLERPPKAKVEKRHAVTLASPVQPIAEPPEDEPEEEATELLTKHVIDEPVMKRDTPADDPEEDEPEEDETKTSKDLAFVAAAVADVIGSLPKPKGGRGDTALLHEPLDDDGAAGAGGTAKMVVPKTVSALVFAPTMPYEQPVQPMPANVPGTAAMPAMSPPVMSPPAMSPVMPLMSIPPAPESERTRNQPLPAPTTRVRRRSSFKTLAFIFVLATAATLGAVLYLRGQPSWPPWVARIPPAQTPAPVPTPVPVPAESSSAPLAASGMPSTPGAQATASATPSAAPSSSAAPSASASASASGKGRGKKPPKK